MRFLANENFPWNSIAALRAAGFDVASVDVDAPGLDDESILAWGAQTGRVILTSDLDYGELVFRHWLPAPAGVVLFRLGDAEPGEPARRLLRFLTKRDRDLAWTFVVIDEQGERAVAIPGRALPDGE